MYILKINSVANPVFKHAYKSSATMNNFKITEIRRFSPIVYTDPCNGTIHDSRRTTLFKAFDNVSQYMQGLWDDKSDVYRLANDAEPVIVTAASNNHFPETIGLFANLNLVLRKMKSNVKVIFYDLGLESKNRKWMKAFCNCEYRQFPFNKFPEHVKILNGYAFKPLAIMMVLNEYPFAIWMDTSIRFKQVNISQLFEDARQMNIIGVEGEIAIARITLPGTFSHFDKQPCKFINLTDIQSGFLIARATPFVVKNILKPWVACALLLDCMVPRDGYLPYLFCKKTARCVWRMS
ncbi:uncharacterized protein LOC127831637 [Dreissena polymorpha]|uniref:Uncharacterized protein n=1 Tax=Dreissena polymorpha TaxID=45954 RepID=A0A9D4GSW6_DREPO|nr:uncharacterized protein LOC127831637 [Dreissena polymorpha]KAH3822327.1 hypothetical protein DPMN_124104 [Dreissena polymorpha]